MVTRTFTTRRTLRLAKEGNYCCVCCFFARMYVLVWSRDYNRPVQAVRSDWMNRGDGDDGGGGGVQVAQTYVLGPGSAQSDGIQRMIGAGSKADLIQSKLRSSVGTISSLRFYRHSSRLAPNHERYNHKRVAGVASCHLAINTP